TYASLGAAQYYRKNGKFADGTVLVKEVFGTDHGSLTTGEVHWAKATKVWFVMIKDDKGRYPGNPLWGDGWGWALFKADAPDKQVATNYKKDCLGCHVPAKTTDWVYIQGYPVLSSKCATRSGPKGFLETIKGEFANEEVSGNDPRRGWSDRCELVRARQ